MTICLIRIKTKLIYGGFKSSVFKKEIRERMSTSINNYINGQTLIHEG